MLIKRLLQFNFLVSVIIAGTFILAPEITLALYGMSGGESLYAITQYFGTTHLSFAILIWLAFRSKEPQFLRFLVVSFFVGDVAGTVVLLIAQLGGVMNQTGWGLVGLSFLFAVGYGYGTLKRLPED
ncbi:MAG: hypothetical protein ABFS17_01885 [Chloroflexota bacterium]